MLVIYPFHAGDQENALLNAQWIAHLGSVEKHQCLLVHDRFTDPQIASEVKAALSTAFRRVVQMPLREGAPGIKGTNLLFRRAVRQVAASSAGPFLWMNPDLIPLREGWLDAIEVAYQMLPRGKRFLGCYCTDSVPRMAAVGVYPQDCEEHAPNLVMADANPFHLNAAPQIVPQMAHTELIVDTYAPVCGVMPPGAVLWHGSDDCRNGELIGWLKTQADTSALPLVEPRSDTANPQGNEKFAVPMDPITQDRAARAAISKAGSEGIPSDEMDTGAQPSGIKPPTVTPIRATPDPRPPRPLAPMPPRAEAPTVDEMNRESMERRELKHGRAAELPSHLTQQLAAIRDCSPADKAAVLAALREAGFPISGKKAKGRR